MSFWHNVILAFTCSFALHGWINSFRSLKLITELHNKVVRMQNEIDHDHEIHDLSKKEKG